MDYLSTALTLASVPILLPSYPSIAIKWLIPCPYHVKDDVYMIIERFEDLKMASNNLKKTETK